MMYNLTMEFFIFVAKSMRQYLITVIIMKICILHYVIIIIYTIQQHFSAQFQLDTSPARRCMTMRYEKLIYFYLLFAAFINNEIIFITDSCRNKLSYILFSHSHSHYVYCIHCFLKPI